MYLTNGSYYIMIEPSGKVRKTQDMAKAHAFASKQEADALMARCKKKTQGYRLFDDAQVSASKEKEWKEKKEKKEVKVVKESKPGKEGKPHTKSSLEPRVKVIRKQYVEDVRRLLYKHADGHCAICGRQINYNEMTIDHIIPLSSGGPEEVENLQCTCLSCNQLKGDMLPEAFPDKIYTIFRYQMDKKHPKNLFWKIARFFLSLVEKPTGHPGNF